MAINRGRWIAVIIAVAVLGFGGRVSAQNQTGTHHHYKMVVIEPLGGPASNASGPGLIVLNNRGTFAAITNTATPNPNPGCFIFGSPPDCFVERAVVWQNGVQTDLGVLPGGNTSQTVGIAANGLTTGWSETGVTDPYSGLSENVAILWTGKEMINLGTLPGGTESFGISVTSQGQVAVIANNDIPDPFSIFGLTTQTRAALWQNGVMKDIGTLGGPDAFAAGMNQLGQVFGQSYTNSTPNPTTGVPTLDPFIWKNGKMWDIGTLGGTNGISTWMNNNGQVTGNSNLAGDQTSHVFVWDRAQGLKDLGTLPGGSFSYSYWINDAGDVVGAGDNGTTILAILWNKGAVTNLGTLPGDCNSEALSINSGGQIVGHSSPDCILDGNVVLWENDGAPVNVNTLVTPASDVTAVYPLEINDRGEIAAHGFTSTGDLRGVLLIPCDANHPNVPGCDYSLVAASSASEPAAAPAKPTMFSNANMMMRIRARMAGRYGLQRTPRTLPK